MAYSLSCHLSGPKTALKRPKLSKGSLRFGITRPIPRVAVCQRPVTARSSEGALDPAPRTAASVAELDELINLLTACKSQEEVRIWMGRPESRADMPEAADARKRFHNHAA